MKRARGFTLIELMLVVAIIGLLAAIAIPKFANLVDKSKEAAAKGKLGAFRSALSIYYADNEGNFPAAVFGSGGTSVNQWVLYPKYIDNRMELTLTSWTGHSGGDQICSMCMGGPDYAFGLVAWDYPIGPVFPIPAGTIRIRCTHSDSKGTTWSLW